MQTMECSIGQSFVVERPSGNTRLTILKAENNEVTLGIEDSSGECGGYREVVLSANSGDQDLATLLGSRRRF